MKTTMIAAVAATLGLAACDEAMMTAGTGLSETMLGRAGTLAARHSISDAQVQTYYQAGVGLQATRGMAAGNNFDSACRELANTTNSNVALNSLPESAVETFAQCAGFFA